MREMGYKIRGDAPNDAVARADDNILQPVTVDVG